MDRRIIMALILVLAMAIGGARHGLAGSESGGKDGDRYSRPSIEPVDGKSSGERSGTGLDQRRLGDPFDRRGDPNPFDRRIDPSPKRPSEPRHFQKFRVPHHFYPPGGYILPQPYVDAYSAYVDRGLSFGSRGYLDAALNDFSAAIGLRPDLGLAYYYRSQVWFQAGRDYEAAEDARIAASLEPGNRIFRDWYFQLTGR